MPAPSQSEISLLQPNLRGMEHTSEKTKRNEQVSQTIPRVDNVRSRGLLNRGAAEGNPAAPRGGLLSGLGGAEQTNQDQEKVAFASWPALTRVYR